MLKKQVEKFTLDGFRDIVKFLEQAPKDVAKRIWLAVGHIMGFI